MTIFNISLYKIYIDKIFDICIFLILRIQTCQFQTYPNWEGRSKETTGKTQIYGTFHFLPLRDFEFCKEIMLLTLRGKKPERLWSCHHTSRANFSK